MGECPINIVINTHTHSTSHAGLDIYTTGSRSIVVVGDGVVTAIMRGWYSCSGGSIDAILVFHSSGPLAGKTINYGEMNPGTYSVRVGSTVRAGERLGVARNCGMLHFELYAGRRTSSQRWLPRSSVGRGCASTSLSTKPSALLDPRPLLQCLAPSSARYRHGISFLTDPESADASLFAADLDDEIDDADNSDNGLSGGAVAGIVLGLLAAVALLVALVWLLVIRRRSGGAAIGVSNEYYGNTDSTGHFECNLCAKKYEY